VTYFQNSKLFALFLLVFSKSYSFSSYLVFVSRLSSSARSILSLIPTFATYIAKREKMHALKNYVQAAVLRTSETVARGSTKKETTDRKLQMLSKISYEAGVELNEREAPARQKKERTERGRFL
jgi:hypothetical protein